MCKAFVVHGMPLEVCSEIRTKGKFHSFYTVCMYVYVSTHMIKVCRYIRLLVVNPTGRMTTSLMHAHGLIVLIVHLHFRKVYIPLTHRITSMHTYIHAYTHTHGHSIYFMLTF